MREEDAVREKDIEATKKAAAQSKERTDEIEKLEEFGEFLTEKSEDEELHLHNSEDDSDAAELSETMSPMSKKRTPARMQKTYAETGSASNEDI